MERIIAYIKSVFKLGFAGLIAQNIPHLIRHQIQQILYHLKAYDVYLVSITKKHKYHASVISIA